MSPSFRQNFEQEGRPEPWAPLSDDTVERRGREGYGGGPILTRSGALKKTVQQLNIWTITRTDATINGLPPRVAYGMVHQQGGFGGGFGRPFLVMQPEDEDAIELVFNEWVAERIAMRWSGRGL
jgi:phage gpG-like protein